MEVRELGHIVLYVRDLDISRRFYRDLFGVERGSAGSGRSGVFLGPNAS